MSTAVTNPPHAVDAYTSAWRLRQRERLLVVRRQTIRGTLELAERTAFVHSLTTRRMWSDAGKLLIAECNADDIKQAFPGDA